MFKSVTDQVKYDLEKYYSKHHFMPSSISMKLSFYNRLCMEDFPDVVKIIPYSTIFGIAVGIVVNSPHDYEFI